MRIAGDSQDLRTLPRKHNSKSTTLVIEPPRPGHAFGQVVRAQSVAADMNSTWNTMHVGTGAVLEPPGDSLDTLYQAWKSDGPMGSECLVSPFAYDGTGDPGTSHLSAIPSSAASAMLKCAGMPASCGSGVVMVNGGHLNTAASANLQGTHSGGVVSPHATSVDSDKSSTIAEVDMMLSPTPCLQKPERKRGADMHMESVEQMVKLEGGKNMVLQQYQGSTHGLLAQAKRARSLEMPGGGICSVAQTAQGGYVPSSLQLSAALVQPSGSPGLLLDSKHVLAQSNFAGARGASGMYGAQLQGVVPRGIASVPSSEALAGSLTASRIPAAGRSQRLTMVPVVSHGEHTSPQVQLGLAQMPSQSAQAVVAAQTALHQSQGTSPRLQTMSALEAVVAGGSFGAEAGLVGRMPGAASLPVEQGLRHSQVFSGHALAQAGLTAFAEGYNSLEDAQHHTTPKRRVQRKRENLPKESTALLKQWLLSHMLLPYPGNEEKLALCRATNLDMAQINNWFINARVRIWKPLVQKVFDKYEPVLKKQAEEEKDEQQLKRIRDARKSSTLNMITLLSGLPDARKELDEIAAKSKALSKDT